jgi:hypothetical protein
MKLLIIGIVGLIAVAISGCGGSGETEVKVGQLVSGEITGLRD